MSPIEHSCVAFDPSPQFIAPMATWIW